MTEDIIIALIGAVASVLSSAALINWRIKKLEEKVDKHNAWGQKFASYTTDIALIQKDIQYIKEWIKELKHE